MMREVRVSIIGDSILVEGIVVGLENNPLVTMQRICADHDDTLLLIGDFKPHVFIYPLGLPAIEELASIIGLSPGVRLVGLDIDCNQVLIVDSHLHHSLSMESFQNLIASQDQDWLEYVESEHPHQQVGKLEIAD